MDVWDIGINTFYQTDKKWNSFYTLRLVKTYIYKCTL